MSCECECPIERPGDNVVPNGHASIVGSSRRDGNRSGGSAAVSRAERPGSVVTAGPLDEAKGTGVLRS